MEQSKFTDDFDIYNDFSKHDNIENTQTNITNIQNTNLEHDNKFSSLLILNNNIRTDIKLGLSIYKRLNNFRYNYINNK